MQNTTIAFMGGGNMASSLVGGLIAKGYQPGQIWVTDPNPHKCSRLQHQFNIQTTTDNVQAASMADMIVLAIKPQTVATVTQEIAAIIQAKRILVVSIAAGVDIDHLQHWLGQSVAIIRCMPNTPALVGCGVTALFANPWVSLAQREQVEKVMAAVGLTLWLSKEAELDSVTALSGSGPAYFFLIMEAMIAAGVQLGLSEAVAKQLTLHTALGAAQMALASDVTPAQLRQQVTSPGGTTERALACLEAGKLRDIFTQALQAARVRAQELTQSLSL